MLHVVLMLFEINDKWFIVCISKHHNTIWYNVGNVKTDILYPSKINLCMLGKLAEMNISH